MLKSWWNIQIEYLGDEDKRNVSNKPHTYSNGGGGRDSFHPRTSYKSRFFILPALCPYKLSCLNSFCFIYRECRWQRAVYLQSQLLYQVRDFFKRVWVLFVRQKRQQITLNLNGWKITMVESFNWNITCWGAVFFF